MAAASIVLAVLSLLLGALLVGASVEDVGDDTWKLAVKTIGLGSFTVGGFGVLGLAPLAGVSLLVALSLTRDAPVGSRPDPVSLVRAGSVGAASWLVLFTLLGVIVDLTELGDDFAAAFGLLVVDLGTLAVLVVTLLWGFTAFVSARRG